MDIEQVCVITVIVSGIRLYETGQSAVAPPHDIPWELRANTTRYAINGTNSSRNSTPKARDNRHVKRVNTLNLTDCKKPISHGCKAYAR